MQRQHDNPTGHVQALNAVRARLRELKIDAQLEGYAVSTASEDDLLRYLKNHHFKHPPFISLLDNGNLRILWKNAAKEQIGIQFRGNGEVQFVLFAKRPESDTIARLSGRDLLSRLDQQIEALNLGRLMTDERRTRS
jgi:hypothetical protein